MARGLKGIKQPHPLGSVPTRSGVSPLTVVPAASSAMANWDGVKISELPEASAANDTDQFEVNQSGTSRRITLDQVAQVVATSDQITDALAQRAETLAALKQTTTLDGVVITECRATPGDQGGGIWTFRTGNQSANVSADPQAGVWAAPDSAPTGASGAWQRQHDSDLYWTWWGPKADNGATDNRDAFLSMCGYVKTLNTSADHKAARVLIGSGIYGMSPVVTDVGGISLEGVTGFSPRIRGLTPAAPYVIYFTAPSATINISNIEVYGYIASPVNPADFPGHCVVIESSGGSNISNCRFRRAHTPLQIRNGNTDHIQVCQPAEFDLYGIAMGGVNVNTLNIVSATYAAGFVTVTTNAAHGFIVATPFTIAGNTPTALNGAWSVAGVLSATSFTFAISSDPGTQVTPGTIPPKSGIGEFRIESCDAYSGSSAWGTDYGGVAQYAMLSGSSHCTILNSIGGSTQYGVYTFNNLGATNTLPGGHIHIRGYQSGNTRDAGFYFRDGANGMTQLFNNLCSGLGTDGVGILCDSPGATLVLFDQDLHNCLKAGVRMNTGYSLKVIGGSVWDIGNPSGPVNGRGIEVLGGAVRVDIIGVDFDNDAQTDALAAMDYALYLGASWTGSAKVTACGTRNIAVTPWFKEPASTGTLDIETSRVVDVSDAANAALRITQRGLGDSLLVEDSTNPDATPFVINNVGNIISGYSTPLTFDGAQVPRMQLAATGGAGSSLGLANWSSVGSASGAVKFARSKSNVVGTHTIVASGDIVGTFAWYGSDGVAFIPAATITCEIDGTPGTNDMPGRLVFKVTPDGAAAASVEAVRIDNGGNLISRAATAVGAGAATQAFVKASSTANLGIYYGTGDPTFSAAKGSLYSKTDATTTTTRLWVNHNGTTGWATLTTSV